MVSIRRAATVPAGARLAAGPPGAPPPDLAGPAPSRGMRARLPAVVAVATIVAAACFVTFWKLGTADWNTDELIYRDLGRRLFSADAYDQNREHPPLARQLIGVSVALLGGSTPAARLPSALFGIATGVVLLALGRRLAGFGAGLAAAGLWWLLPQAPGVLVGRVDRYAMLEPATGFLWALALLFAWRWSQDGRRRDAAVAGLAAGLAASAKFTGALAVASLLLAAAWAPGSARARLGRAGIAAAAAAAGFLIPYLASGPGWPTALRIAIEFQRQHAASGHELPVAGTLYTHQPWWSNLWWQAGYLGVAGTIALWVATAALALAWRDRRRAVVFTAVSLAVPVVVVTMAPLKLPHYHLAWAPLQALAAGIGLAAAWRAGLHRWRRASATPGDATPGDAIPGDATPGDATPGGRRAAGGLLGAAALAVTVVLAVVAAGSLRTIATMQPDDYRAAAGMLAARGMDRSRVLVDGYPEVLHAYLPRARLVTSPTRGAAPEAVVVDPFLADRHPNSPVAAYLARNASDYVPHRFSRITLYVRSGAPHEPGTAAPG